MWPDRVSNQGPLTYESGALPTALRGQATCFRNKADLVPLASEDISLSVWMTLNTESNDMRKSIRLRKSEVYVKKNQFAK